MAPQTIEEYLVRELVKDSSNSKIVKEYLEKLDKKDIVTLFDNYLDKDGEQAQLKIPVSILRNRKLSSLGLIIKFLREEAGLSNGEVASQLKRSHQVCWTTYNNTKKRLPNRLSFEFSEFDIPVQIFRDMRYSVLESIVVFLKGEFNLSFHEIAILLSRDDRTIWTVYSRAIKK